MSRFWQQVRKAARAAHDVVSGPVEPNRMTSYQRAAVAGAIPAFWQSDHLRELQSFSNFTYQAVHSVAKAYASASLSIKLKAQVKKSYGSAQDSPDELTEGETNHPAYKLLNYPNRFVPRRRFLYQIGQQLRLTGGALIWVVKNKLGKPFELWVLPRGWVQPQRPAQQYPYGYYRVQVSMSSWTTIFNTPYSMTNFPVDMRDAILIGWPDPLYPGECQSPLAANERIIDTANMTERAVWASMWNGIKPSLAFSVDPRSGVMPTGEQLDRFEAQLQTLKAGPDNVGKFIYMLGLSVQQLNADMAALQGIEARKQNREFVYGVQGVTPTMTGAVEQTSYAGAAVAVNTAIELGVQPDLDEVVEAITHFLRPYYGHDWDLCLDAKRMDDPQLSQQWASIKATAYKDRVITGNEYRSAINLPSRSDLDDLAPEPVNPMQPGMGGERPGDKQAGDEFDLDLPDLGDDVGDETSTGIRNPLLQRAGGNMNGVALNGRH